MSHVFNKYNLKFKATIFGGTLLKLILFLFSYKCFIPLHFPNISYLFSRDCLVASRSKYSQQTASITLSVTSLIKKKKFSESQTICVFKKKLNG